MCLATLDQVLGKKASSVLPLEVAANRGWTDLHWLGHLVFRAWFDPQRSTITRSEKQ